MVRVVLRACDSISDEEINALNSRSWGRYVGRLSGLACVQRADAHVDIGGAASVGTARDGGGHEGHIEDYDIVA